MDIWSNDEAVVRRALSNRVGLDSGGRIRTGNYRWDDWRSARKNDPVVIAFERDHNPKFAALSAHPSAASPAEPSAEPALDAQDYDFGLVSPSPAGTDENSYPYICQDRDCPCVDHITARWPTPPEVAPVKSELNETQKMRGRPVTADEAMASALRLIHSHFGTPDKARCSIPAQASDDDVVVCDYIRETRQAASLPPQQPKETQ